MTVKKTQSTEVLTGIIVLALTVLGTVLFFLGFSTGYYTFGEMQSVTIAALLGGAILLEAFCLYALSKWKDAVWVKVLTFGVTGLLAAAAMLLVGDRVEGIGNCIVTDYDSGHGGEEAIYYSLGGVVAMLLAVVFNLIGSFTRSNVTKAKTIGFFASAGVLAIATVIATLSFVGVFSKGQNPAAPSSAVASGGTQIAGGVYTVSYNANHGNAEADTMPRYQFLCSDLSGMVRADSRFFVDITLTLDGNGGYTLSVDSYVKEGDYRSVIGDDTGLGLILTTQAEGTYTDNGDGTVTTSVPTHAVFEMETDTYSQQMKGAAQMNVNGNDADGVYDSNDEPAVLDFVPETTWTLKGTEIVSYRNANAGGVYRITYNMNAGNAEADSMPHYQFLCSDLSGMVRADSRIFIDLVLDLDGSGRYTLHADAYVKEGDYRSVIGDDTGLGMVLTTDANGTYTENADGTITTAKAEHAVFIMETDTYSSQLKGAAQMNVNGNDGDGTYDSDTEPAVLDFVPETIWTLSSDKTIVTYAKVGAAPAEPTGEPTTEPTAPAAESVTIPSDDGGTEITFNPDGTYRFWFEAYSIEDIGTYTYADGVLMLTDKNGVTYSGEGDPIHLHYGYSGAPDQLTGEYTIPAATFDFSAGEAAPAAEPVVIPSDDGGTEITFNPDSTYRFWFEAYSIEDIGTYTYADGVLTLTDKNGIQYTADGDPMHLHYGYSGAPDQLTGEYTIPAAAFDFGAGAAPAAEPVVIASDDGGTAFTFRTDGTAQFAFESYGIYEECTYTYADGKLTVINPNGLEAVGEGDPIKLHYVSAASDMLTGDYTIPAATFDFSAGEETSFESFTVPSDDGGTEITFNPDGTYRFWFASYSVEDLGIFTFEKGVLTLTDKNGVQYTANGDPIHLHYGFSGAPDQLTGEYTIDPAKFGSAAPAASFEAFTVPSDDGGTEITFNPDGTYRFWFTSYSVEDLGTFTFENGVLTLTDKNGVTYSGEGDPIHLHYGFSGAPDQLTGEYTIDRAKFGSAKAASTAEPVTVTSVDGGTTITFNGDGTYRFFFEAYNVEDLGTYTVTDGVLTVVNANGLEMKAEDGKLHYISGVSDMLTGDFEIDAAQIG